MPYADVNGARLFYTDEGEGTPVLLVHGWSCDGSDWSWQTPALKAAGYRCIVPDLRGHGHSSVPESGFTPAGFAADLAELLLQLGAGPAIAIGHSMGGAAVVALAVEHSERVHAVVPVDAAYGFDEDTHATAGQLIEAFKGPMAHEVALRFAAGAFYTAATPAHLPALHARRIAGFDPSAMWKCFAGLLGEGSWGLRSLAEAYLSRVQAPALAFRAGSQGPAAMAEWERARFSHPKSHAVAWEGTGHWLHQERPAEFNAILLDWLKSLD